MSHRQASGSKLTGSPSVPPLAPLANWGRYMSEVGSGWHNCILISLMPIGVHMCTNAYWHRLMKRFVCLTQGALGRWWAAWPLGMESFISTGFQYWSYTLRHWGEPHAGHRVQAQPRKCHARVCYAVAPEISASRDERCSFHHIRATEEQILGNPFHIVGTDFWCTVQSEPAVVPPSPSLNNSQQYNIMGEIKIRYTWTS